MQTLRTIGFHEDYHLHPATGLGSGSNRGPVRWILCYFVPPMRGGILFARLVN
jgi:hypothetical protein